MSIDSLTAFDIAVLAIIGVSILFAFGRGFATVALSFAAWAGAFFITFFSGKLVVPYVQEHIDPPFLANIITFFVIFFVSLFILKSIAEWFGQRVKESPIGLLDRSLGALFGLLRGAVIISFAYLIARPFIKDDTPDWVADAQLRPLVAWGAEMVEGFVAEAYGEDPKELGADYLKKAAEAVPNQFLNEQIEEQAGKYLEGQRKELESLFDTIEEKKNKDDNT